MSSSKSNPFPNSWMLFAAIVGGAFVLQRAVDQAGKDTPVVSSGSQGVPTIEDTPRGRDRRMRAPLRAHFGLVEPAETPSNSSTGFAISQATQALRNKGDAANERAANATASPRQTGRGTDVDSDLTEKLKSVAPLDFLIVTVADPIDSAENYRFDLQLEALHKALAANARDDDVWLLDRYYLPWQIRDPNRTANSDQLHTKEPGVLLYRRALQAKPEEKGDHVLLVYIVGELPTAGLHKQAFQESVEEIQFLSEAQGHPTPRIRVVGPTFTGSAHSLARLIKTTIDNQMRIERFNKGDHKVTPETLSIGMATGVTLSEPTLSFTLITGSALGIDRTLFDELNDVNELNRAASDVRLPRVEFGATVVRGGDLRTSLLKYIGDRNSMPLDVLGSSVVGLFNSGSGSNGTNAAQQADGESKDSGKGTNQSSDPAGRTSNSRVSSSRPTLRVAWLTETGTGFAASTSTAQDASGIEITNFPYPLHISRVRLAYERRRAEAKAGTATLGPKRFTVPIPFEPTEVARDLPGAMTPNMTAASVDVILGQILDSIRREGIRYVGITATDIRDPIFLANVIRDHCPDVQLLLITPDQLHGHPEYQQALAGALVASSYPFFSEAQDWSFPFAGRQQTTVFSNQGTAGLYNAVLLHRYQRRYCVDLTLQKSGASTAPQLFQSIDRVPPLICYDLPMKEDHSSRTHRPPVWISMVGTSGIWPMRADEATTSTNYTVGLNYAPNTSKKECKGGDGKSSKFNADDREGSSLGVPRLSGRMAALTTFARGLIPLAVLIIVASAFRFRRGEGSAWAAPLVAAESAVKDPPIRFRAICYLFTIAIPLIVILLAMAGHSLLAVEDGLNFQGGTRAWLVLHGVLLVETLCAIFATWWLVARAFGRSWLTGLILTAIVSTAYVMATWNLREERVFVHIGASDLSNGVALLLPALLVSLVYVAYGYTKLRHLDQLRRVPMPRPEWCHWPESEHHSGEWWEVFVRRMWLGEGDASRRFVALGLLIWCLYIWFGTVNINPLPIMFSVVLIGLIVAVMLAWSWFVDVVHAANLFQSLLKRCLRQRLVPADRDPIDWEAVFSRRRLIGPSGLSGLLGSSRGLESEEWQRHREDVTFKLAEATEKRRQLAEGGLASPEEIAAAEAILRVAQEDLRGEEIERFVRRVLAHLRTACLGLTILSVILFLAAGSFPFNTAGLLRLTTASLLIVVAAAVVRFYIALDRDEFLSRIAGTEPNQIVWDWTLLQNAGIFGLLALVALVSQAFPEVWQWMRTIFEPLMKTAR